MTHLVAVTGANGFLGRLLVPALLRCGCAVRAVVRDPFKWQEVAADLGASADAVTYAVAELGDRNALARAFDGSDIILHNAALANPFKNGWDENYRPNVLGTENVLHAMARSGIRRLIYVSSIGAYKLTARHALGLRLVREEDPVYSDTGRPQRNANRVTKALAEERCRAAAGAGAIDLTILRTSAMYGPHDPNVTPIMQFVTSKRVMPVPKLYFPLAFAPDVASAIAEAVVRADSRGRTYNLAGPADVSIDRFCRTWRDRIQARTRLVPIPLPVRIAFDNTRAMRELDFRHTPLIASLDFLESDGPSQ
ncbi:MULTISPECIES: NAD-dependent epimerase/dehydratase family protein [unclassified Thiocapsa]|uniref:NAD-dependent epimerase/dehydratase family protein n=1 Tax=unclassified Thiocapsa TaxID=2641286 RepID=UPI0035AE2F73